jgi:hypothetical protein
MSDARTDDEVIAEVIEEMKAACGCHPWDRERCVDPLCPNSPKWGGLVEANTSHETSRTAVNRGG